MCVINWLRNICKRNARSSQSVDMNEVGRAERIVRFLLSPMHFRKNGELRSSAFNPTKGTKDVSVSRLEVLSIEQIKPIAKALAANNPKGDQCYYGSALHTKESAILCGAKDVVPEPLKENIAHAELQLGEVRENEDIHAETQEIRDNLAERCKLLKDPNTDKEGWSGDAPMYDRI